MTSIFPKLSYSATMKSSILLSEQGERVTVEECTGPDFRDWIEGTLATFLHSKRSHQARVDACLTELAGLSFTESLERWWAILILQEHKISMDLAISDENVVEVWR